MLEAKDSVLDTVKKILGLESDYTAFDLDIITHINSVLFTLNQLGVGPEDGFFIMGREALWSEFIGTEHINAVKTYVAIRVRLLFDPPSTSFAIESMLKQAQELEWRLNVHMEGVRHPSPNVTMPEASWWVTENGIFPAGSDDGDLGIDPETGDVWRDV